MLTRWSSAPVSDTTAERMLAHSGRRCERKPVLDRKNEGAHACGCLVTACPWHACRLTSNPGRLQAVVTGLPRHVSRCQHRLLPRRSPTPHLVQPLDGLSPVGDGERLDHSEGLRVEPVHLCRALCREQVHTVEGQPPPILQAARRPPRLPAISGSSTAESLIRFQEPNSRSRTICALTQLGHEPWGVRLFCSLTWWIQCWSLSRDQGLPACRLKPLPVCTTGECFTAHDEVGAQSSLITTRCK